MLLLWILVGSVGGVVMLAAVPVEVAFRLESHEGHGKTGGTLSWLFGAARIPLGKGESGRKARKRDHAAPERSTARRRQGRGRAAGRLVAVLGTEGFPSRLLRFVHDVLHCIRIQELVLRVRLGLDDPADTGRLWALLGPVAGMLAMLRTADIAVEPQFTSAVIDIDMHSRIRLVPLRLLLTVLIFGLSPGTLRALRAARAAAR